MVQTLQKQGWHKHLAWQLSSAQQVKKEEEEELPLNQLISCPGCAASHLAMQACRTQSQDGQHCQSQVQASQDSVSEQQARQWEELWRSQEQASAQGGLADSSSLRAPGPKLFF
uniref:Uncharacterized protein n=1 Tax=Oryctolagus cuniculus TaxID=9986 RepID=A0A5F9CT36_RABIT